MSSVWSPYDDESDAGWHQGYMEAKKLSVELKLKIEELVGDAYEIGHAHGSSTWRMSQGQEPLRANEGWGKYYEKIIKLLDGR